MQIAYLLYNRFTALDITGPHDVFNSVPGNEAIFVAEEPGEVRNESDTLSLMADASIDEVQSPDIVVVPGGFGNACFSSTSPSTAGSGRSTRRAPRRPRSAPVRFCFAAAGLLDGAPATTHWLARTCSPRSPRSPCPSAWFGTARSSPRPASPRESTWRCGWCRRSKERTSPGRFSSGSSTYPDPPLDAGSPEKAPQAIIDLVSSAFQVREAGVRT
jgi:DJ-1/PfpI family